MQIKNGHLCYCSNIHPGESWDEIFQNLKSYTIKVKEKMTNSSFGIGLRLSNQAADELLTANKLSEFIIWLKKENMYVFTINGFPYGNFHGKPLKDHVHTPDWSTEKRLNYTKNCIQILGRLLPKNMEGSISTSPISYRHWHKTDLEKKNIIKLACQHLTLIICELIKLKQTTGTLIHLDLEPEPDGMIETSQECVDFFNDHLIPFAKPIISDTFNRKNTDAEKLIKDHIQICFDVCHFAVGFENPKEAINTIQNAGIKIGKIQISAALSSGEISIKNREKIKTELRQFDEPIYLHQAIIKSKNGKLKHFKDLGNALNNITSDSKEIRTHYHVPIFTTQFKTLRSTQLEIIETLNEWKKSNFSNHIEVETYTWEILPKELQTNTIDTIVRELDWVKSQLNKSK